MNKIEKLFKRMGKKERVVLVDGISKLIAGKKSQSIKKIRSTNFYRLRIGNFRIIFHRENSDFIIDDIRLRNEKTYKKIKEL